MRMAAKALGLVSCLFATGVQAAGTAHITVDSPSVTEGDGGPGTTTLNFTLTRSGETNSAVTLQFQTDDNSAVAPDDYTAAAPGSLVTFAAGQLTVNVPVPINGDVLNESNESLFLHLTGIVDVLGPPASYATANDHPAGGTDPYSVTATDVNGDGRPDLAVANRDSNVSVLLNTTAPGATTTSYAAASNFAADAGPVSVTATDVNGDGRPDLAVANLTSSNVSVLLNTTALGATTASYAAASNFAVGTAPRSVTATDVNGDGRPDLAVANGDSANVSVLLNTTAPGAATASYAAASNFTTGIGPYSVTAADVNGDGRPDLAVANYFNANVSVLLNTTAPGATTASYAARSNFAVGSFPNSVIATDVDGDGRPDLAVANSTSDNVSVLLNTTAPDATTASYAAASNFAAGGAPYSVTATDVNGDGRLDLAVANLTSSNVSVLLNTTAPGATIASYAAASNFAVGAAPYSVTATDANGDGRPDLAVANSDSGNVSVLLNTTAPAAATASYAAASNFAAGDGPYSVTATDVNGDGRPDLAVANADSDNVSVLLNTTAPGATTASYAAASNFAAGDGPFSVTATDVNGDGRPDLAVANFFAVSNNVSVLLNTTAPGATTASYAAASTFTVGSNPYSVTATDVNGDGRPDLAVANVGTSNVSVLLNTTAPGATTASYAAASNFAVGTSPASVTATDVNGDGRPDLVAANADSDNVSVLLNTTAPGATTATYAAVSNFAAGDGPYSVTATDVNGDGRPDLAVSNVNSDNVSVLLNTTAPGATTASYAAASTFAAGVDPYSVTATDVNGDGRPDLAVANLASQNVSVLLNTTAPGATASYAAASNFAASGGAISVTASDVNGDGRPDLAVANNYGDNVSVLLNRAAVFDLSEGTGTILDDDDTTPNAFSFTDVTGVPLNTQETSNTITVGGINDASPISVTGGSYSVGCTATFTATAGTINNGQTVCVRHTSSASYSTATNTVLTIGGVPDTFTSTTAAAPPPSAGGGGGGGGGSLSSLTLLMLSLITGLGRWLRGVAKDKKLA
jgi:hypothetical protein